MKHIKYQLAMIACTIVVSICYASENVAFNVIKCPAKTPEGFVWKSEVPEDCPFEQSDLFNRIYFTGRHSDYRCGDTFYPSWASDDNLYAPWTDGGTDGVSCRSYPEEKAHTGHAIMIGDDPLDLIIKNTSPPKPASPLPNYRGRYPAGSLVYNGIWYYGTYCLGPGAGYVHNGCRYNWPILGPMPGFQISFDYGKTWQPSPHSSAQPLFPEPKKINGPVKMGAPHFVDFGKNMEHSPDGKAYLLGMGAEENDPKPRPCIVKSDEGRGYKIVSHCPGDEVLHWAHANLSWITADQVYLSRVTPSVKTINDEDAYEYFGGHDKHGSPIWTDDFEQIKPLIEWNNNMGCVTATYVPQLKKYLMCITDGWPTTTKMDSYILEADQLTGPWRMITYMKAFGEQAYFLNFPSKFIHSDGKSMWLCYSANFWKQWNGMELNFNPPGGRYGLCLHEMRFLSKDEQNPIPKKVKTVNIFEGNIAPHANVTASSTHHDYSVTALVDSNPKGYPTEPKAEWASLGEKTGAWVKLEWDKQQKIYRILLFDRPNTLDHIKSGLLIFSDGSFIHIDQPLPDVAREGLEIKFAAKHVTWVMFQVLKTNDRAANIGLAEMAVFTTK